MSKFHHFSTFLRINLLRLRKLLRNSLNRACLYGVLAMTLLTHQGMPVWPRGEDVHFCHTSAVPFTFSIRHFSESCSGPQESPLYEVPHLPPSSHGPQNLAVVPAILKMRNCAILLRPLLSSKSFKNDCNYKHSWSGGFSSWSLNIVFSSKPTVIISIFGVVDFLLDRLILGIFIFPEEILKFWYVHRFINFVYIAESLYFQWKTTHFATFTESSFSVIFHFCYTSLLIFKILMPIFENLNISKDQ